MASITTAMSTTLKAEMMEAAHCFNATVTATGTMASAGSSLTALSSVAGIAVGMNVAMTGVLPTAVPCVVSSVGSNSVALSAVASAAGSGSTYTFSGDVFKIALIVSGYTGTYGATTQNYSDLATADQVANGAGYTTTGSALTNTTATTNGTGANINFNNPSWTSATFSTTGAIIYNTSARLAGLSGSSTVVSLGAGRCCGVYTFNGVQTVSTGTFTVTMPAAAPATAILAIQ